MAMSPNGMADDVIAALAAAGLTQTPDHRWWQAVCQGIITHIKVNMDVLPDSLGLTPLSNDAGQPISGADPQGGTVVGSTTAPLKIIGTGSAK